MNRTAGADVKRPLRIATVDVARGDSCRSRRTLNQRLGARLRRTASVFSFTRSYNLGSFLRLYWRNDYFEGERP
jgi:hypothetical protein